MGNPSFYIIYSHKIRLISIWIKFDNFTLKIVLLNKAKVISIKLWNHYSTPKERVTEIKVNINSKKAPGYDLISKEILKQPRKIYLPY